MMQERSNESRGQKSATPADKAAVDASATAARRAAGAFPADAAMTPPADREALLRVTAAKESAKPISQEEPSAREGDPTHRTPNSDETASNAIKQLLYIQLIKHNPLQDLWSFGTHLSSNKFNGAEKFHLLMNDVQALVLGGAGGGIWLCVGIGINSALTFNPIGSTVCGVLSSAAAYISYRHISSGCRAQLKAKMPELYAKSYWGEKRTAS